MTGMRPILFHCILLAIFRQIHCQESSQYLQNVIHDLRTMKGHQTLKRVDTIGLETTEREPVQTEPPIHPQPAAEKRIQNNAVPPPLSLTKGELAALYEAAVAKGETVKLNSGDNSFIHAAVHELNESPSSSSGYAPAGHTATAATHADPGNQAESSGYYYYYYPIKSFLDEITSQPSSPEQHYSVPTHHEIVRHPTAKPHYQYHSHTHQHNVKITSTKEVAHDKKDKKALEPLFMAISGFIGMAVMFVLSVLVFPKFGIKKPLGGFKGKIKKSERITDIARVALQAIEGKDCQERFACELEKTARAFNLHDNRFMKLLKRLAPNSFGKQMDKVGKHARLKCTAIPCTKKNQKKAISAGAQKKP